MRLKPRKMAILDLATVVYKWSGKRLKGIKLQPFQPVLECTPPPLIDTRAGGLPFSSNLCLQKVHVCYTICRLLHKCGILSKGSSNMVMIERLSCRETLFKTASFQWIPLLERRSIVGGWIWILGNLFLTSSLLQRPSCGAGIIQDGLFSLAFLKVEAL